MAYPLCNTSSSGANEQVVDQFSRLNQYTTDFVDQTNEALTAYTSISIPNVSFSIPIPDVYDFRIEAFSPMTDTLEDVDVDDITGKLPDAPDDVGGAYDYTPGDAPTAPSDPPPVSFTAPPGVYTPAFGADPPLTTPVLPAYQDLTSGIPFPDLEPITIPTAPDIDLDSIQFTAAPPAFTADDPDAADFAYVEPNYVERIIGEVQASVHKMLNGESGLPAAVEDAIWQRQATREDQQAYRALDEARKDDANRGFSIPSGPLMARVEAIKQNNQNQRNSLGRDVMIQQHKTLIEQLQFGVAQGIALEAQWMQLFNSVQNRKLQAARFAIDLAINVYNAKVAKFQAEAAVYKVESEVYVERVQAELAKLQAFGEEIRAQQLIGQINEQMVRVYHERLQAIETNVRVYLADLEGYKAQLAGNTQLLEQAKLGIEKEISKLNASEIEVRAWTQQMQGEEIKQQSYATRARTYMANVEAFSAVERNKISALQLSLEKENAISQRYNSQIAGYRAYIEAMASRAQQIISANEAKVQKYAAETSGKSAYNEAYIQQMRNIESTYSERTQLALKNAEINSQNALASAEAAVQQLQAAVQVLSQLSASALSAHSVNANISDSSSQSFGCSYNTSTFVD